MLDLLLTGLQSSLAREPLSVSIQRRGFHEGSAELAAALEPFMLGMCEGLAFCMRASKDERAGRAVTFANGQVLHYLLDDLDLLPETTYGALGWLDDALLVHRYAAQLLHAFPWLTPSAAPYSAPAPHTLELVRTLLPDGVGDALERTSRNVVLVATALIGVAGAEGRADAHVVTPELRFAAAVARL